MELDVNTKLLDKVLTDCDDNSDSNKEPSALPPTGPPDRPFAPTKLATQQILNRLSTLSEDTPITKPEGPLYIKPVPRNKVAPRTKDYRTKRKRMRRIAADSRKKNRKH